MAGVLLSVKLLNKIFDCIDCVFGDFCAPGCWKLARQARQVGDTFFCVLVHLVEFFKLFYHFVVCVVSYCGLLGSCFNDYSLYSLALCARLPDVYRVCAFSYVRHANAEREVLIRVKAKCSVFSSVKAKSHIGGIGKIHVNNGGRI